MAFTVTCTSQKDKFNGLKATNEQQDDGAGILYQVVQFPTDEVQHTYNILIYKVPMQDPERQGTVCKADRPIHPSKPPTSCSERQLKHVGGE